MGNKQSQSRENSPTNNNNNNDASTVPESTSNEQENNTIQSNSDNITDQLQQLFLSNSRRSRNSNSTSSPTNNETANTAATQNDLSNMLSSLFSSSSPSSSSSNSNNNSTLASSISRTISGNNSGRLRIFERNGAYFAYVNGRLIQLQAPRTCPYCNKQINPFQEEYELHVVKCMTKPRIKSVTFEVTAEHSELISGDKECMICYEEYGKLKKKLP